MRKTVDLSRYAIMLNRTTLALGGTLSSYTWICLILSFLQTRNPPVLPCLHQRPHLRLTDATGKISSFADDIRSLRGFGERNKETLGELLFHFFRRYAHEIDYEKSVVSVREGRLISKEAKKWHLTHNNRLCVEEPFNTERNLGNTADDCSFRGVHLELRRAFDLLSEARLDECLEQYTFPLTEEKSWEKPPAKPVVLARSRSQSQSSNRPNKPGLGNRNGKHPLHQYRSNPQARRTFSAATMSKLAGFHAGPRSVLSQDPGLQAQFQLHLHDQLYHEFQLLQAQEQGLRALHAQAQAQVQLQAQAKAHGSNATHMPPQSLREAYNRSGVINPGPLSAPLRNGTFPHPLPYQPMPVIAPHSTHTNPSSPSSKPAQPELRRNTHRSSIADSASTSSLRSHSQPARPVPLGVAVPNLQAFPLHTNSILAYDQARANPQHVYNTLELNQGQASHPDRVRRNRHLQSDLLFEENLPKEYIGYYVHNSPPPRPFRDDLAHPRIPATYHELSHRFRGVPAGVGRLINPSRSPSPSPLLPFRDRSYSVRSASSAPLGSSVHDRHQNPKSGPRPSGPIVLDGSAGWSLHDYPSSAAEASPFSVSMSEVSSPLDVHDTPNTTTDPPRRQSRWESTDPDVSHPQPPTGLPHESNRISHASRNGIIEPLKRRASIQANEKSLASSSVNRADHGSNGYGLGIDFENVTRRMSGVEANGIPTQELPSPSVSESNKDPKSDSVQSNDKTTKPTPLLSPVREVRTPSPTANRKDDISAEGVVPGRFRGPLQLEIPPFSSILAAKQKRAEASNSAANGTSHATPASPVTGQSPQANGWQQASRKHKKNKSKGHVSYSPVNRSGEPLPINESERKGG